MFEDSIFRNKGYISKRLKNDRPRNIPVLFLDLSKMPYSVAFDVNFGGGSKGTIETLPDECPFCHNKITPNIIGKNVFNNNEEAQVIFLCPTTECRKVFIGYYVGNYTNLYLQSVSIGTRESKTFHDSIVTISPSFIEIYNQAYWAEQYDLKQICGVGYRKALEFLIKDFAIKNHPKKEDEIKKNALAKVIGDFIDDDKVKKVSKRAVWIGNDETHYVKTWENKDLQDLKTLIDLTLTMIQGADDFDKLMADMPEPKKV